MVNFIKRHQVFLSFLFSIVIIILRRPDAIFNPQFWAEDGTIWFAKAYNEGGFDSLLEPQNGYFQTVSKLTAWISLLLPMQYAPLFFNVIAIIIKALPVALLWSRRFSNIIPSFEAKLAISAIYLLLPTIGEVHSNITNAHWHLALYAFMILISQNQTFLLSKIHDLFFIILAGLSGPFSIILSPIVVIFGWIKIKTLPFFYYILAGLILVSSGIQIFLVIFTSEKTRSQVELGASLELFIRLISGKLFGALLFGEKYVNDIAGSFYLSLPLFILGMLILLYAVFKAKVELRLLILFSTLLIAAAFSSPMVSENDAQWPLMTNKSTGARYFFVPLVTWASAIIWFLGNIKNRQLKNVSILIVAILMLNVFLNDFKLKPYKDKEYSKHIKIFLSLPKGSEYKIPINPGSWEMSLTRK